MIKNLHSIRNLFRKDRKKAVIILLLIIMVFSFTAAVILNLPKKVKGAWFNDKWAYRQTSLITNSGSAQTNYNLKLTVNTATLISASKMQSDCDDIRVTDETGNLIKFWIEPTTCNTSSTIVWLKVPSVVVGTIDIYFYYGNPGASTGESPTKDVFIREILNLNAMWKIDESSWTNNCSTDALIDSSGNSNVGDSCDNGIGPTTPVTGKFGNGVELTGLVSNQVGFYVNPGSGITDNETFSVAFWVKTGNTSQTSTVMYNSYTGPLEIVQEDGTGAAGGKLVAIYGGVRISSTYTFSETTTWHHVVVTRSATDDTLRFYVDGAAAGTSTSGTPSTVAAYGSLGMKYGGGNRSFVGFMDEVSVFGTQLSAAEISDLYTYYGYATTNYGDASLVMNRVGTSEPTVGSLASEESGPGPISYWKFDEGTDNTCSGGTNDTCDTMGKNDGAINSGTAWKTEDLCVSGKCLFFDGSDDYIDMGSPATLDDLGDFTVSTWIRPQGDSGSNLGMLMDKRTSSNTGWFLSLNRTSSTTNYRLSFGRDYTTTDSSIDSSYSIEVNKWYFVTASYNSTTKIATLYINGRSAPQDTVAGSGTLVSDASVSLLAGKRTVDGLLYKGFMDDMKIYNYARTAEQVKTDYISRGTVKGASAVLGANAQNSPDALSNGLVGYWKMDEAAGGTRSDSSGNAYSLTVTASDTIPAASGKYSLAADFERGDADGLYVADNSAFSMSGTDFTLAAWFKQESVDTGDRSIISKYDVLAGNREYLLFRTGAGLLQFVVSSDGAATTIVTSSEFTNTVSVWDHVIAWYDSKGQTINIQVNGGKVDTVAYTGAVNDDTSDLMLGSAGQGAVPISNFDGLIDEARIYRRMLSGSERATLYNWAPGPVGYWKLDENTGTTSSYDSSGNSLTATITAMSSDDWVPGKYGSALDFNGTDDVVSVPYNALLDGMGGLTVAAWVRPTACDASDEIVKKDSAYIMRLTAACLLETYTWATTDANLLTSTSTIALNTWTHVALVYDGATQSIYINGVREATTDPQTGSIDINAAETVTIGADDVGTEEFAGKIDEIKIYNYARNAKQIVEDINANHPVGGSPSASQIGYWNFDEQQGQTANNKGFGSGINATLGNTSAAASDDPTWKVANSSSCKINGCLNFDGTADFAFIADDPDLDFDATTDLTITFWMNSASDEDAFLVIKRGASSQGYNIYLGTGSLVRFQIGDGTNTVTTTPGTKDVADNTWHHIAMTVDRTNDIGRLYVDGRQEGPNISISAVTGTLANSANLQFGREDNGTAFFNGSLDEPKIYNSALTADEIKIDYNAGSAITFGGVLGTQDAEGFGGNAPVGEWRLDENQDNLCTGGTNDACDTSGNGSDGALTSGPTWTTGKVGAAVNLDGTDDYITMGDPASEILDISDTTDFTITGWFKIDDFGALGTLVAKKTGNTAGAAGYLLYVTTGGKLNAYVADGTDQFFRPSSSTLSAETWYHFAFVFDEDSSTNSTFYVNGIADSGTATGTITDVNSAANAQPFVIGAESDFGALFDGIIDNVKIHTYAFSQAQIAYDYNRGAPQGLFKFDECQGTTAYNAAPAGSGLAAGSNGTITPGAGSNTTAGTCGSGTSSEMWNDGTTGKRGASLGFDGTDDYVSLGSVSSFNTANLTWSAWVKTTNDAPMDLFANSDPTGNNEYITLCLGDGCTSVLTNELITIVHNPAAARTGYTTTTRTELFDGNWHHVAMTADGSIYKLYLDGRLLNLTTGQGSNDGTTNVASYAMTTIGAIDRAAVGAFMNGQIDDARIYNYALTQNQIKQVINSGAAFFGPATGSP